MLHFLCLLRLGAGLLGRRLGPVLNEILSAADGASPSVLNRGASASAFSHYKQVLLQHLAQQSPTLGLFLKRPWAICPRPASRNRSFGDQHRSAWNGLSDHLHDYSPIYLL
jgi:hypothetical protein